MCFKTTGEVHPDQDVVLSNLENQKEKMSYRVSDSMKTCVSRQFPTSLLDYASVILSGKIARLAEATTTSTLPTL